MTICVLIIETLYCGDTTRHLEFHNPMWTYRTSPIESGRFCQECKKHEPLASVEVRVLARNEKDIKEYGYREDKTYTIVS